MKKHNLLKVLGITFLVVLVLTWIIPSGYYYNGEFVEVGTSPQGFFDLARTPLVAVANLIQYGILFALIGGFYGVLEKTGAYLPMVDKVVKKWKGKESKLLALLTVVFTIISAVTGLDLFLLVLTPFIASIVIGLGCDKISAMLVTIGSIIIGKIGSVYSTSVSFYSNQYFGLENNADIWVKVVICFVVTALYTLFVVNRNKKSLTKTKEEKTKETVVKETVKKEKVVKKTAPKKVDNEVKAEVKKESTKKTSAKTTKTSTTKKSTTAKKNSSKKTTKACAKTADTIVVKNSKSALPLIIALVLVSIIIVLAMYNWETAFNITFFTDLYTNIMSLEVKSYPLVANIIGSVTSFGSWGIYDLIIFLSLVTPIIGWIYGVKLDDMIDGFIDGVKKALPAACLAVLANVIYAAMYSTSTGANIMFTIANWLIGLTKDFSVFTTALLAGIGSLFFNDYQTLIGSLSNALTVSITDSSVYSFISIIFQSIYGIVMMIAPTSVLLIGGLGLFDISFKDWFKNIWKFLLKLFVVIVIIFVVIAMFI